MRRTMLVAVIVAVLAAGCAVSDTVDGPFIEDWQVDEQPCEKPG